MELNSGLSFKDAIEELLANNFTADVTAAITLLSKYSFNILSHHADVKYQKIRLSNSSLQSKILGVHAGYECMLAMGFSLCSTMQLDTSSDGDTTSIFASNESNHIKASAFDKNSKFSKGNERRTKMLNLLSMADEASSLQWTSNDYVALKLIDEEIRRQAVALEIPDRVVPRNCDYRTPEVAKPVVLFDPYKSMSTSKRLLSETAERRQQVRCMVLQNFHLSTIILCVFSEFHIISTCLQERN